MSYKSYLIPLKTKSGTKRLKLVSKKKKIPFVLYGVVKNKSKKLFAAVAIDRPHSEVKRTYGKKTMLKAITKEDIMRKRYKVVR